jgi:holo-[acyl-carrier protein] synthase
MIVGVGIDLVSVTRISEKIKSRAFVEKVFSQVEIDYCESSSKKEQHYAGRFAAKEAFLKATGKGLGLGYDLKDITVVRDEWEKPGIQLSGDFKTIQLTEGWNSIHISLSHEGDNAVAIVIIEK